MEGEKRKASFPRAKAAKEEWEGASGGVAGYSGAEKVPASPSASSREGKAAVAEWKGDSGGVVGDNGAEKELFKQGTAGPLGIQQAAPATTNPLAVDDTPPPQTQQQSESDQPSEGNAQDSPDRLYVAHDGSQLCDEFYDPDTSVYMVNAKEGSWSGALLSENDPAVQADLPYQTIIAMNKIRRDETSPSQEEAECPFCRPVEALDEEAEPTTPTAAQGADGEDDLQD